MNRVFETYVETVLRQEARTAGWQLAAQAPRRLSQGIPMRPDLVLRYGGRGDDRLTMRDGWGDSYGGPGRDRLVSRTGDIRMRGGLGDDVLLADPEGNVLDGGGGADRLRGASGPDQLHGGGGRDTLRGHGGGDLLTDGDRSGAADAELLDAGANGELSYASRTRPVHVDLSQAAPAGERGERDVVRGVTSIMGGRANDVLTGSARDERLSGSAGADRLAGRGGDDVLMIEGADRASGGHGADRFGFGDHASIQCGPGHDVIGDQDSVTRAEGRQIPGPWLSRTCEAISYEIDDPEDNFAASRILLRPPKPVFASTRGRLIFKLPCPARRSCLERLSITAPREPFATIVARSFTVEGPARRVSVDLPAGVAARARRGATRLRARLEIPTALGTVPVTWRFDIRLPST